MRRGLEKEVWDGVVGVREKYVYLGFKENGKFIRKQVALGFGKHRHIYKTAKEGGWANGLHCLESLRPHASPSKLTRLESFSPLFSDFLNPSCQIFYGKYFLMNKTLIQISRKANLQISVR